LTPVSLNGNTPPATYVPAFLQNPGAQAGPVPASAEASGQAADNVQLSPAALREVALTGRVAANVEAGNLTSDQAQQLYGQISSIASQIAADRQANGGKLSPSDRQALQQSQDQLSGTIYSDAHNGATPPSDPHVTLASAREAIEAGRIALNESAGNLSGEQAQQLGSQLGTIQQQIAADEQANGGTLSKADAQAIDQLQNQFSQQIYQAAHGVTPGQAGGSPS